MPHLAPCPNRPNCVSSVAQRHRQKISPWRFGHQARLAFEKLTELLEEKVDVTLITVKPDYLQAEFRTPWLRFVDDVEFVLDPAEDIIHARSASRLGYFDFGVNRRRIEALHAQISAIVATCHP